MTQRVYIKVVGFTDTERHALNTVFRLSEDRETAYSLWAPEAPEVPKLALLDASAYESRVEAESPANKRLHLVWVGDDAPANTWRAFQRPIIWAEVVQAMDQLFAPAPLDFDLEFGSDEPQAAPEGESAASGPDTQPSQLEEPGDPSGRRALIASADRDERLYLRAKLALSRFTIADEAETVPQALELIRGHEYQVAVVDFGLPGGGGWGFVKMLTELKPGIPHLIVTKSEVRPAEQVRAWMNGAKGFLNKPPDPEKLQQLLDRV